MKRARWQACTLALLPMLGAACTKGAGSSAPEAVTSVASSTPPVPSVAASRAAPPLPRHGWAKAMRAGDYREVLRALAGLGPEEARDPRLRFVRARAALANGDPHAAVSLLQGLEGELPILSQDVLQTRALAQVEVGPFEPAARYFALSPRASDRVRASRAWERARRFEDALKEADAGLTAAQREKARRTEAEARHVRARVLEASEQRDRGAADYRWLATQVPTSPEAEEAAAALVRVQPRAGLSPKERRARVQAFGAAGDVDAVNEELGQLGRETGKPIPELEALRGRGYALYASRRDPLEAAALLEKAAQIGRDDATKDSFYAARSRVRGRDESGALRLLEALSARKSRSPWVERARFERARVELMLGRWQAAAQHYGEYLKRHPQGADRPAAEYERAVAWLAGGEFTRAAAAFKPLVLATEEPATRARLRELMAAALAGAGQRDRAVAEWKAVVDEHPLGFSAMLAIEHLKQSGEAPPLPIPSSRVPSAVRPALGPALSPRAELLAELGLDADAEQDLREREPELRRTYGARADEALCTSYASLAVARRRFSIGRRQQDALLLAPGPDTRWAWECSYPRPYSELVLEIERSEALPADLLYAVMRQESAFNPEARSPADALGLLQLIPPTARNVSAELGLEWRSEWLALPWYNVRLGAHYLKKLLTRFGAHPALAVAAYNAGPQALSRWLETGERLPLDVFVARIPYAETREYVHLVLTNLGRYRYLALGEAGLVPLSLEIPRGLRAAPDDY